MHAPTRRLLPPLCLALLAAPVGGCLAEFIPERTEDEPGESEGDGDGDGDTGDGDAGDGDGDGDGDPPPCDEGLALCDDVCVDLSEDSEHCGACFDDCRADSACVEGECLRLCSDGCDEFTELCVDGLCRCRAGFENCQGVCADLRADPDHCGECFFPCAPQSACGDGQCIDQNCDGWSGQCETTCTDVEWDPLHCGDCEQPCPSDEVCILGECQIVAFIPPEDCNTCPCIGDCDDPDVCCESDYAPAPFCALEEECPDL